MARLLRQPGPFQVFAIAWRFRRSGRLRSGISRNFHRCAAGSICGNRACAAVVSPRSLQSFAFTRPAGQSSPAMRIAFLRVHTVSSMRSAISSSLSPSNSCSPCYGIEKRRVCAVLSFHLFFQCCVLVFGLARFRGGISRLFPSKVVNWW